jgi:hypothetical protein
MRTHLLKLIVAATILAWPSAALAQRTPHSGSTAVGGDVGLYIPQESGMSTGPDVDGFFEYYVTARDSVRVDFGWANPKFERETSDSMRQIRVGGDVIHNWEGGSVHPFVGAGLGAYSLQQKDNGNDFGDSNTRIGGNLLAGVEYFTSNTFAIKGEAAYHIISKINDFNPSGLLLSIGGKVYF